MKVHPDLTIDYDYIIYSIRFCTNLPPMHVLFSFADHPLWSRGNNAYVKSERMVWYPNDFSRTAQCVIVSILLCHSNIEATLTSRGYCLICLEFPQNLWTFLDWEVDLLAYYPINLSSSGAQHWIWKESKKLSMLRVYKEEMIWCWDLPFQYSFKPAYTRTRNLFTKKIVAYEIFAWRKK